MKVTAHVMEEGWKSLHLVKTDGKAVGKVERLPEERPVMLAQRPQNFNMAVHKIRYK